MNLQLDPLSSPAEANASVRCKSLALEYNGKIASVANCYECYGIIYNKAILEKYCSNYSGAVIKSVDDIKDLDTLYSSASDLSVRCL